MPISIATYNIHKGFSHFNRRVTVHELRDRLRVLAADIVFLQEVQGLHLGHAAHLRDWPTQGQHEFLADSTWNAVAYGKNVVHDHGHHGNAILSRYPILHQENQDISDHRFEGRGLLHGQIGVPELATPLHCVCLHLGLFARGRKRQLRALIDRMQRLAPRPEPLIVAGDFNDWRNMADGALREALGVEEVFSSISGSPARSFPAVLPVLRLDRIYVRGFAVVKAEVLHGPPWSGISDHAVLSAHLQPR